MSPRAGGRLHYLGVLVHVPALLALSTLPVCALSGELWAAGPFALAAVVAAASGQALMRGFRPSEDLCLRDGMIVAALAWLVVPLAGALPLFLVGRSVGATSSEAAVFAAPVNALFEAMSGFTSTGLTMSEHPSELPRAIQWWRSMSQWIGGLGVIVLMLALVRPGAAPLHLYRAEAREERVLPSVKSTVRAFLGIYAGWTTVGIIGLWLSGAPAWEALNHGLTALATGGFTITDRGSLGSPRTQMVLMALVVVGALSFNAHARLLRERKLSALWADGQHRLFWLLLAGGIVAVALENRTSQGEWLWGQSAFQAVSALGTAGFQSARLESWSEGAKLLLVAAMIIGGAAGSTAGGIKMARAYLLLRGVEWRYRQVLLRPHEVMRHAIDGRGVSSERAIGAVEAAAVLAVAWVVFLFLGALALLHLVPAQASLGSVFLEVASAQGNVGLSSGITTPALPLGGKLVLMGLMWIGRLEILPILILLRLAR